MTLDEYRLDGLRSWELAIAEFRKRLLAECDASADARAAPSTGDAQTDVRHGPKEVSG